MNVFLCLLSIYVCYVGYLVNLSKLIPIYYLIHFEFFYFIDVMLISSFFRRGFWFRLIASDLKEFIFRISKDLFSRFSLFSCVIDFWR